MATNTQVNNSNQGSTSTTIVPAPAPTKSSSSSTSAAEKSGQALAGALWEALSEMTVALNKCISIENEIGLQACKAANTMTDAKANADQQKAKDSAVQMRLDAYTNLAGAGSTLITTGISFGSNYGLSKEVDGIDTNITRLNDTKANLDPAKNPVAPVLGRAEEVQGLQAERSLATTREARYAQLKDGTADDIIDGTSTTATDKEFIARTLPEDREPIKTNLNKQIKYLEEIKGTRQNVMNYNQTKFKMISDLVSQGANATTYYLKSKQQEDVGQQDYNSAEAANVQQQMSSLIGSSGSAQSTMANSSSQAIQAYTEMEKANANSSR